MRSRKNAPISSPSNSPHDRRPCVSLSSRAITSSFNPLALLEVVRSVDNFVRRCLRTRQLMARIPARGTSTRVWLPGIHLRGISPWFTVISPRLCRCPRTPGETSTTHSIRGIATTFVDHPFSTLNTFGAASLLTSNSIVDR